MARTMLSDPGPHETFAAIAAIILAHMETINRDDRWNYFSAIAAIVAIIWKQDLSDISLGGRLPEVLGRLSFPEVKLLNE